MKYWQHDTDCSWRTFEVEDIGVPGGANKQDSWFMANRPEYAGRKPRGLGDFKTFLARLQEPGGARQLPDSPQRPENMAATIYHALGIPADGAWFDELRRQQMLLKLRREPERPFHQRRRTFLPAPRMGKHQRR